MFVDMLKKSMPPGSSSRLYCSGKGGNVGRKYMIDRAIQFLTDQGHSGKRDQIMIVGDRFDTVSLPLPLTLALTLTLTLNLTLTLTLTLTRTCVRGCSPVSSRVYSSRARTHWRWPTTSLPTYHRTRARASLSSRRRPTAGSRCTSAG